MSILDSSSAYGVVQGVDGRHGKGGEEEKGVISEDVGKLIGRESVGLSGEGEEVCECWEGENGVEVEWNGHDGSGHREVVCVCARPW